MKKKMLLFVCLILAVCAAVFALAACDRTPAEEPSDISRSVSALYIADGDEFSVTLEVGAKETPFVADGKVGEVKEFASLTLTPLTVAEYDEIAFVITGGEQETLSGTLTAGGFGDFKSDIPLDFVPAKISVTAGGQTTEFELSSVLEGKLTAADAVNVARKLFADLIEEERAAGSPSREIYVKLITGDRENFYYYVSFIGEGTDYWGALVKPEDGSVVSRRP